MNRTKLRTWIITIALFSSIFIFVFLLKNSASKESETTFTHSSFSSILVVEWSPEYQQYQFLSSEEDFPFEQIIRSTISILETGLLRDRALVLGKPSDNYEWVFEPSPYGDLIYMRQKENTP